MPDDGGLVGRLSMARGRLVDHRRDDGDRKKFEPAGLTR